MPRLALIATGGTIAGTGTAEHYTAATLDATTLLATVPALSTLASWHVEQLFSLDSRDLQPAHWVQLATRIQALIDDPAIDGIIVTHGTDTLEETAFALHLLLAVGKPVILTAAMRPANLSDADGPANLHQAARVALHPHAGSHHALIVAHGTVIAGHELVKAHTSALDALRCRPGCTPVGHVNAQHVNLLPAGTQANIARLPIPATDKLPRIDILYAFAGVSADLPTLCLQAGAQGLVLALTGQGSIPTVWRPTIQQAIRKNLPIIRASRIAEGRVDHGNNEDDSATGCVAAGVLNPQQARVLAILAMATGAGSQLRQLFAGF